tara:strand:+ start:172 stop:633 length:462 start_codon:yes stop_codon:yes gene_type:complete
MTDTQANTEREQTVDPVRDYIGYVKWFDDSKGYGFVRILTPGDKYENDVFVHQSNIHPQRSTYRTLRESETVRFNLSVETDESVTPQVVELVGVNGRLYCDSRMRRRRTNQSGDDVEDGTEVTEASSDNWEKVGNSNPRGRGRGRGRPRKTEQ